MKNQYRICTGCGNKTLKDIDDYISICDYCMTYIMYFESVKTIRDRLNKNKSLLTQETHTKLTKTLNQDLIEDLKKLIEDDKKLLDVQ